MGLIFATFLSTMVFIGAIEETLETRAASTYEINQSYISDQMWPIDPVSSTNC